MKSLIRNIKALVVVFVVVSVAVLIGLIYQQDRSRNELGAIAGENTAALASRYGQNAGAIYSKDGRALAISQEGQRTYPYQPDSDAYIHIVGDYSHHMTNTIEAAYENRLMGNDRSLPQQLILDLSGRGLQGDDIRLTLHDGLSQTVSQAMGYQDGGAIVLNWQTGAILASVSKPAMNYADLTAYNLANIPDTGLFNRALSGAYMPGSTFKIYTAAAWLDSPIYDPDFTLDCDGEPSVPNGAFDGGGGHGPNVDLVTAFARSSNEFFGELGVMMGRDYMLDYLEQIGFTEPIKVGKLQAKTPKVEIPEDDLSQLSWSAVGQPVGAVVEEVSPLSQAMFAGAIANGGVMMEPQIIDAFIDPLGNETNRLDPEVRRQSFSPATAADLRTLMHNAAEYWSVVVGDMEIGMKTGTAEREDQSGYVSTVVSYSANPNYPYAMCVILDNAAGGHGSVTPIIQQIYYYLYEVRP